MMLCRIAARTGARFARPAAIAAAAGALVAADMGDRRQWSTRCDRGVSPAVHAELAKLRPGEAKMHQKWEEDEEKWHELPPRAWPAYQPKAEEVSKLRAAVEQTACPPVDSPKLSSGDIQAHFDLATCLTFNLLDPEDGLMRYRALAERGHVDSMVAVGIVLLEGIGCDIGAASNEEGCAWLQKACALGHAQGQYELGCLHYLGSVPELVEEDEAAAYRQFERAASQQHTSALFMQAECLLEGSGVAADPAAAVPLLYAAAQRGHRLARQYVREWLDEDAKLFSKGGVCSGPVGGSREDAAPCVQEVAADSPGVASAAAVQRQQALAREQARQLPNLPAEGSEHLSCFTGRGEKVSLRDVVAAAEEAEIVFIGECHDDPIAHAIEAYMLVSLAACRPVRLSLEQFETDVQPIVNEYLLGLIREEDFLQDSRPWVNYHTDYRPLVEFSKYVGCPVSAANAPRRYVGAVGRNEGMLAEGVWPAYMYGTIPPLPLPPPSASYVQHLLEDAMVARMDQIGLEGRGGEGRGSEAGERADSSSGAPLSSSSPTEEAEGVVEAEGQRRCPYVGLGRREGLVLPLRLWDATMAHSICGSLAAEPERLVVHVCGSFHVEKRLGIVEMVEAYRPAARQLVIVVCPERDCHQFVASRHEGLGDYVILSDASVSRSHDYNEGNDERAAHG